MEITRRLSNGTASRYGSGTISYAITWRWMGPGGPRGLQSRCEARRTSRVCSIRTRLRHIRRNRSPFGFLLYVFLLLEGHCGFMGSTACSPSGLKTATPHFRAIGKGGVLRMPTLRSNRDYAWRRAAAESVCCDPDGRLRASLPARAYRRCGGWRPYHRNARARGWHVCGSAPWRP